MKRLLVFIVVPFIAGAQSASSNFIVSGELQGMPDKHWVYLKSGSHVDSARVSTGKFILRGKIAEPGLAFVAFKSSKEIDPFALTKNPLVLFLAPGITHILIKDSISNYKIQSVAHNQYASLLEKDTKYQGEIDKLWKEVEQCNKAGDTANGIKKRKAAEVKYTEKIEKVYIEFVKSNPKSALAIYALNQIAGWLEVDLEKTEPLLTLLPKETLQWASAKQLLERLEIARRTAVGKYAIDFTQPDTSGQSVSLSSFRGKYVLVDFWASWCGPCRKENPNLINAYRRYSNKNFLILGVSFDRPGYRQKWIEAIFKDGLLWTQVSELKGFNNTAAKEYGIKGIPYNILLDPEGKIIAKNLQGEKLISRLEEIFRR
jgi:peroxiredoxin